MRDPETIETELMEISAIADDSVKFERIVAWCATHPDEVPFALHQLLPGREKHPSPSSETCPRLPLSWDVDFLRVCRYGCRLTLSG